MPRIAALIALTLLFPATASAGTYHVYSCGAYANNAWTAQAAAGVAVDTSCAGGTLGVSAGANATMANNTSGGLVFTSPAGTAIADFSLSRQLDYVDAANKDTHQYFLTYQYGATVFAGAGDYLDATRNALNAQKQWYGYPAATAHVARTTVTRHTFPALNSGSANTLQLRAGCFNRTNGCSIAAGGGINNRIYTSDVTIDDPTPPSNVTVDASGLLAGGQRDGSDPVTVSATDNTGIASVQLIDLASGAPVVVGSENYANGSTTDNGRKCDFSKPAPCPNLTREVITPTSLPFGYRSVIVRVTDTGGNVVDRGPYTINAITPSDRGAYNGANGTETATMQVAFTHAKAGHRTVSYGDHIGMQGRLRNSGGSPISGAQIVVTTTDLRRGAATVQRKAVTTRADGSFSYTAVASASRLVQFGWRAHVNDTRFTANGFLTLNARADAHLSVSTKHPRVGRRMTISGHMAGVDREGVTVLVQGRAAGSRTWETFADTEASRAGTFKVHYRFKSSGSRGKHFVFRARLRPGATTPYKTGYSNSVTVQVH